MFNDPAHADIEDFKDYRKGGKRSDPAPVNFFWDKCQKEVRFMYMLKCHLLKKQ